MLKIVITQIDSYIFLKTFAPGFFNVTESEPKEFFLSFLNSNVGSEGSSTPFVSLQMISMSA